MGFGVKMIDFRSFIESQKVAEIPQRISEAAQKVAALAQRIAVLA